MNRRTPRFGALVLLLLLLTLLLVACGGGAEEPAAPTDEPTAEAPAAEPAAEPTAEPMEEPAEGGDGEMAAGATCADLPVIDPLAYEGDITIAGSSTVGPLTEALIELFLDEGFPGNVTNDEIGSGAGFERFCVNAETDISNASRPIREEEIAACEENGRTPLEFRVGTDALAITVSRENDFVDNLTLDELAQIFSGEAATWADVNPDWPAETIELYSPGTDSGTFDFFVEEVLDEDDARILGADNIQFSENDNVLVQGVEGSPNAIGYFGYAYYLENEDLLRTLSIEGVEPNAETAESGEYPLARPLFIYSAPSIIEEKPQVGAFIAYYLNNVNELIGDVGYFPASQAALDASCAQLSGMVQ